MSGLEPRLAARIAASKETIVRKLLPGGPCLTSWSMAGSSAYIILVDVVGSERLTGSLVEEELQEPGMATRVTTVSEDWHGHAA